MSDSRLEEIKVVRSFVKELKSMETEGQDRYPYWYIFKDEFRALEHIIDGYERFINESY